MLDNRPILKDRLMALATFTGIALGGVAGVECVITGGFDFLSPGAEIREVAPSSYVQVVNPTWLNEGEVIPLSSREPLFAHDDYTTQQVAYVAADADDNRRLLGDGVNAPRPAPSERTLADIQADIDALYRADPPLPDASAYASPDSDVYRYEPESKDKPETYTPASFDGVNAYADASPW